MNPIKSIVFMGTPEFAAVILKKLLDTPGFQIKAAVTQPDRPKGRGRRPAPPPVKELAEARGVPVIQPAKLRDAAFLETLSGLGADIFVVAAYGKILPEAALKIPPEGCINVHASLLPKYRGAAPIQWAVINGEEKTGVTIMRMDKGIDTGDMLLKTEVTISPRETYGSLLDKLAEAGADALIGALGLIGAGASPGVPQDNAAATCAPMLTPEIERIDWKKTCMETDCLIRGLNPSPAAYSIYGGQKIKIWAAEVIDAPDEETFALCGDSAAPCGSVVAVTKRGFAVKTADGALMVTEVQPAGGKRMGAGDYARGHGVKTGEMLE